MESLSTSLSYLRLAICIVAWHFSLEQYHTYFLLMAAQEGVYWVQYLICTPKNGEK